MKKALKKTLKITGIVFGLIALLVVAAALLVLFDKPLVRNVLQAQIGKRTGMTVHVGKLDYSLFPFQITIDSLELGQETAYQKMTVSLTRLEARGGFWKLVRGTKPALETIEADGLVFHLDQKAISEEPMDVQAILLQVSDALAWARKISVTHARLSLGLLSMEAGLDNLDLTLTSGDAVSDLAYSIGRSDLSVKDKAGAFSLTSGLTTSGNLQLASPFVIDASFNFGSPRVASAGFDASLAGVTIEATGRVDMTAHDVAISRLKVGVPGLLDLDGTAAGTFGHNVFLEAEARVRLDKLENLAALIGPRLPAEFRGAKLRGRAELSGKYGIQRSSQETKDSLSAALLLEGVEFDHVLGGSPLHVRASGWLDAAGPSKNPRLSADLRASLGKMTLDKLALGSSEIHLVASGTKDAADISRLDATLSGFDFAAAGGKKISFDKVTLSGNGRLDLGPKTVTVDSLEARLPGLAPLRLSGRLGLGNMGAAEVTLESRGLDIPALRGLAAPFIPESFAGWDFGGTADLSLEARRPSSSKGDWSFSGSLSLAQAKFNDPSFTIAGEGLDPVLKFEGAQAGSQGISFTTALDIGQGESLWKAVYISWNKHPLKMTISGRYDPDSGGMDGLAARFLLPTIGEVNLAGSAGTRPSPSFDLRADARLSLGPLYSLYSQAGASEENRMRLEGTLGAGLLVRKDGQALSVTGRLTLADANIERPLTKTLLLGVTADLPVHYESGNAAAESSEGPLPDEGFLRIKELQNTFVTLKLIEISLHAGMNTLAIEPLSLDLYGGRIELGRTTFRFDPRSGSFQGVGSLALREMDISRFPIPSPQFKLTGKVRAEFPRLDISSRMIAISGRGEADVFGGKVILRDLSVSNPFTPGRSISLNVDLIELDLKKLTDEVPFGEVTGIVSGEIRGLVITYNQPERFDFRLESVPRKGVPQTFSLKAVDSLTVLSSGAQASGGSSQFWMRFIRGFRYQKLGIVSTLRNDTFTLNGTIHEGGVEYLVKKPALFGISVVNRMPEKSISFKEMTSRLRRVGQSDK
jgi:hypothetical protein